jgi:hypothetical protein
MINWFIDNGVGISAGVISDDFNGADPVIYNAMKRCASVGMDKCTIWNHGQDAQFHFAEATSVQDAQQRIQKCDAKIKALFPGYQPFLMTPHQNSWGPYLLQALKNLGYKVISASAESYSGMTWDLTSSPMQMPQQATTGDWEDSRGGFVGVPVSRTVADCEAAAARGEVCVIMTHPHEFTSGEYDFNTLSQLVQSLKDHGFTSTNFYTVMNEQLGGVTSTPTVKPAAAPTQAPAPTRVPTTAVPSNSKAPTSKIISTDGRCGIGFGNTFCGDATEPCCSEYGWCGASATHCGTGCQSPYGLCDGQTFSPSTQPVSVSTPVPTKQPVSGSTAVPTKQPTVTTVAPSAAPNTQPVAASTSAPTKQPTVATSAPSKSPTTAIISTDGRCGVGFGNTFCGDATEPCCSQWGWCGASADHCSTGCQSPYGLCDGQTYSPSTQPVAASTSVPTKQPVAATSTVAPTSQPVATTRQPTLATTSATSSASSPVSAEITDNRSSTDSNSNRHGLFSFPMSGANISIVAGICFFIVLCFIVVAYFVYQRCYNKDSDDEEKRITSVSTTGSNEEMLSPSEQFVELELNGHYSLPRSDDNEFVEDACIHRHGLTMPNELENV